MSGTSGTPSEPSEEIKQFVEKAITDKFKDKDYVVRDVQYEALDNLSKIIKIYSTLIGIPVALIVAFFAFEGIKTARDFLGPVSS